ncbi:MAG: DUF4426 domain-containing protein [Xanthomonadales bacterium]|nr:DUF4426 domain-containing protein [Xanthomonadales bacterium]
MTPSATRSTLPGRLILALLTLGCASGASAERMVTAGEFVIHFNAVSSLDIPPEVARERQITRSAQRALVNIAVRRLHGDGDVAVRARVEGMARNDVGQTQTLWFREVTEGDAIYYLADPRVELEAPIRFEIDVQPADSARTTPVRFSQTFFAPR